MELKEVLSISGVPGLYKYVAQGKGGIIVESLNDSHRTMVGGSAKVSALGDIAIFTDADEVPLADVFQSIYDKNSGSSLTLSNKSTNEELSSFMESVLPSYDRERVRMSDIKKLVTWYNILIVSGMTQFKAAEESSTEEGGVVIPKAKTDASADAAAKKQAVKNSTPKAASQPKVVAPKSTTARKSGN